MRSRVNGLASAARSWFGHRPEIARALQNFNWLLAQRLFDILLGLVLGVMIARLLGPQSYGLVKYLLALVAIPAAIAAMGFSGILVRELVHDPSSEPELFGSALLARSLAAVVVMTGCVLLLPLLRDDAEALLPLLLMLVAAQLFNGLILLRAWFDARVESKPVVLFQSANSTAFAAIKVGVLALGMPLWVFVAALSLQTAAAALVMLAIYLRGSAYRLSDWRPTWRRTRQLVRDGLPMMANGLMAIIYLRVDQIMLGQMRSDAEVGIYSVSTVVMDLIYTLPVFALTSIFPALLRARIKDEALYSERLQLSYDVLLWAGIAAAIVVTALAPWAIPLVFGQEYAYSATVLGWHVWALPFYFTGAVAHRHLLAINTTGRILAMSTAGAIVNVATNLLLIPTSGAVGAAIGTIAAFAVSHCLALAIFSDTRFLWNMFVGAWVPWSVVFRWRRFLRS